jgi:hypothetical protein
VFLVCVIARKCQLHVGEFIVITTEMFLVCVRQKVSTARYAFIFVELVVTVSDYCDFYPQCQYRGEAHCYHNSASHFFSREC